MKKITMLIIFIIFMTMNVVSYGALSYDTKFTYSGMSLPPVVLEHDDLLLCARAHTTLSYGNKYVRTHENKDIYTEFTDNQGIGISYIVSETRRTGKYRLNGTDTTNEINSDNLYSSQAQQVAFWSYEWDDKANFTNGDESSGVSHRLDAWKEQGDTLTTEADSAAKYFTNYIEGTSQIGDLKESARTAKKSDNFNVFPDIANKKIKLGPISVNYPDNIKIGDMRLVEISDIVLLDEAGNTLGGTVVASGMTKSTSGKGTEYWNIESGKEFYIEYTPENGKLTVPSIQIKINFLYLAGFDEAKYHAYENETAEYTGQPLTDIYAIDVWKTTDCIVEKEENPEKEFDLSLKKSIIQIGDTTINQDRVTVSSTLGLKERIKTDAVYHKNTSIPLVNLKNITDTNNKIIYRIRIYNEGDIPGKATKIEDYLPSGLEYVGIKKGEYDVNVDGNKITLNAKTSLGDIPAFNGNKLECQDIEIECRFTNDFIEKNIDKHKLELDIKSEKVSESWIAGILNWITNTESDYKEGDVVKYTITVTNKGTETENLNTIMQTLPEELEFKEVIKVTKEDNDIAFSGEWTEVIENSDNSKYVYYNLKNIVNSIESNESITIDVLCEVIEDIEKDKKITTKCKIISTEVEENEGALYNNVDTTKWYSYEEKNTLKNADPNIEYTLTQTIENIIDKNNNLNAPDSDHMSYEIKKGDIIEYKIKVSKTIDANETDLTIATYLPDGLEMIPVNNTEMEELKVESENTHIDDYNNTGWDKVNDNTLKRELNAGDEVTLYCVVTDSDKTNFKTISEIISEYEDTATSNYDNVDISKYLYEKQESDDDWSEVTTCSETETEEKFTDLKIDSIQIEDDKYIIKITNLGKQKATINKIYSHLYGGVINTEATNIDGFEIKEGNKNSKEIILTKGTAGEIEAGNTITITIPYKKTNEEIYLESDGTEKQLVKASAQIVEVDGNEKTKKDWYLVSEKLSAISGPEDTYEYGYITKNALKEVLENTAKIVEVKDYENNLIDDREETDWIDSEKIKVTYDENVGDEAVIMPTSTPVVTTPPPVVTTPPPVVTTPPVTTPPVTTPPVTTPTPTPTSSPDPIIKISTEISGYVFEDNGRNKENEPNSLYDADLDTLLQGIKVTLKEKETNEVATLFQENEEKSEVSIDEAEIRTNPTLTDINGEYSFKGVNPLKEYYVEFEYNGVLYETVDFKAGVNPDADEEEKARINKINSKALETSEDRENLNESFANINVNSNTYSKKELTGKTAILYSYNGKDNLNIYELITEYTKKYIEDNKATIMSNNGKMDEFNIYNSMKTTFSTDIDLCKKLDFIEKTKIKATTQNTYPLAANYVIDDQKGTVVSTQISPPTFTIPEDTESVPILKEMYDDISEIAQKYVEDKEGSGNPYGTMIYVDNDDPNPDENKFYQRTVEGNEEYGNYITPIVNANVTIDANGVPKYTYEPWTSSEDKGYLYYLRNQIAYLLNTNRERDLKELLNDYSYYTNTSDKDYNRTYNKKSIADIVDDTADGEETTTSYAEALENLETASFVKETKSVRLSCDWTCSEYCRGNHWSSYKLNEIYITKNETSFSERSNTYGEIYKYEYVSIGTQGTGTKKDTYTINILEKKSEYGQYVAKTVKTADFRFYYWRDDGTQIANNGITTCNVLVDEKSDIESTVNNVIKNLNENELKSTPTLNPKEVTQEQNGIYSIYDEQFYVNLGLKEREEFDLTIAKDIYSATVKINGREMTYNYNNIDLTNDASNWIATVRLSDVNYERNIYSSDYMSVKNITNPQDIDVTVKYRIALSNQTANVVGKVTELVDYYDNDYRFEKIYIGDGSGNEISDDIWFKSTSTHGDADGKTGQEKRTGEDLQVGYITFANNDIHNKEDKFIYITFKVTKTAGLLNHDGEITAEGLRNELVGNNKAKTNIVEINGYETVFEEGYTKQYAFQKYNQDGNTKREINGKIVPAGLLDKDSSPGNYTPDGNYDTNTKKYKVYEDDEAVAGGLYLIVNYKDKRTIEGTVWEDSAIKELLELNIRQGDGKLSETEKLIQNVKVELLDAIDPVNNPIVGKYYDVYLGEWKDAITYTDGDGNYRIENFIPGSYVVRFTYNNNSTNIDVGSESSSTTYYNGQDYKSTIYSKAGDTTGDFLWYINDDINERKSDAADIYKERIRVNEYSKTLTNDIAESLIPTDSSKYALEETTMLALTFDMEITVEYNKQENEDTVQAEINKSLGLGNADDTSEYIIKNIDFGLVERPRAQLSVQKNVANVKIVLADGTVLFDALPDENGKFIATNVGSIARKLATAYVETKEEGVPPVIKLKNSTHVSTEQGRITMNMDEELMQGANLQVTYEIEVRNVGEIDDVCEDGTRRFYYRGIPLSYNADGTINISDTKTNAQDYINNNSDKLVKTKVDQIIDYVENNMKFNKKLNGIDINTGWEVKKEEEIGTTKSSNVVLKDTVIKALFNNDDAHIDVTDDAYNTIAVLTTTAVGKTMGADTYVPITTALKPDETAKSDFILTQLISPENENDDLTYKNVLEIIKTTNDVGRRMYFSIPGNHIPVERDGSGEVLRTSVRPSGREIDTDDAELITIIPPFGANMQQDTHYAIFGVILAGIFAAGVYLIKKKVLK